MTDDGQVVVVWQSAGRDGDGSGRISVIDALIILKAATGQQVALGCVSC